MYTTRHVKRDGTVETTIHKDGKVVMATEHQLGLQRETIKVPGKFKPKLEVMYNFSRIDNNGKFLSADKRKKQIREHMDTEREIKTNRKIGTLVKTHCIPSELYWKVSAEQGTDATRDRKYMKRMAEEHGFGL